MKKANNGKFNYKIFYAVSILFFIASIISSISGNPSGVTLALGSLFLILGAIYSGKDKGNKGNKGNKDNKDNKDNENNEDKE